jgi:two-component system, OmpR family, response regulator
VAAGWLRIALRTSAVRTFIYPQDVYDRRFDVEILHLRRKLKAEPSKPQLIRTERGLGYRFTAAVKTT